MSKIERFVRQLKKIRRVNLFLQYRGQTLSECRMALDILLELVGNFISTSGHPLDVCRLGRTWIGSPNLSESDRFHWRDTENTVWA